MEQQKKRPRNEEGQEVIPLGRLLKEVALHVTQRIEDDLPHIVGDAVTQQLTELQATLHSTVAESIGSLSTHAADLVAAQVTRQLKAELPQRLPSLLEPFGQRVVNQVSTTLQQCNAEALKAAGDAAALAVRAAAVLRDPLLLPPSKCVALHVVAIAPLLHAAAWFGGALVNLLDMQTMMYSAVDAPLEQLPTAISLRLLDALALKIAAAVRYGDWILVEQHSEALIDSTGTIILGAKESEPTPSHCSGTPLKITLKRASRPLPWPLWRARKDREFLPGHWVLYICQICGRLLPTGSVPAWATEEPPPCSVRLDEYPALLGTVEELPIETGRYCDLGLPSGRSGAGLTSPSRNSAAAPRPRYINIRSIVSSLKQIDIAAVVLCVSRVDARALWVELGDPSVSPLLQLQLAPLSLNAPLVTARLDIPKAKYAPISVGDVIVLHRYSVRVKDHTRTKLSPKFIADLTARNFSSFKIFSTEEIFTEVPPVQGVQSVHPSPEASPEEVATGEEIPPSIPAAQPSGNDEGDDEGLSSQCAELQEKRRIERLQRATARGGRCLPADPQPYLRSVRWRNGQEFVEEREKPLDPGQWIKIRELAAWAGEQMSLSVCGGGDFAQPLSWFAVSSASYGDFTARVQGIQGGEDRAVAELSDGSTDENVTIELAGHWAAYCLTIMCQGDVVRFRNVRVVARCPLKFDAMSTSRITRLPVFSLAAKRLAHLVSGSAAPAAGAATAPAAAAAADPAEGPGQ